MLQKKNLLLVVAAVIAVVCIGGGITAAHFVRDARENEEKLYTEVARITAVAEADVFDEDAFNELLSRTVCTGSCAKAETAVKAYVRDLYNCFDEMARISASSELPYLISADNIGADGPAFETSLAAIRDAGAKTGDVLQRTQTLLQSETVQSYMEKQGAGEKSAALFEKVFAKPFQAKSADVLAKMQTMHDGFMESADGCTKVLEYLRDNPNDWYMEDGSLLFVSDAAASRFSELQGFIGAGA